MNCLNCYKLDWEIDKEQEKKNWNLLKIIAGIVAGLIIMLVSWYLIGYLITQRHQNIVQEQKSYLQNNPQQVPKWEQLVRERNLQLMEQMLEQEKSIMSDQEYQKRKDLINKLKSENGK